ncbi:MAG: DUF2218 domain-containing protein [Actinoallomurus sp.]
MPTAEAHLETDRPSRYLIQLCRHAAAMSGGQGHRVSTHAAPSHRHVRAEAEWSDTHGVLTFDPWGRCTLDATATTLVLRVEAGGEEGLRRIQEVIAADLARFGHRDRLTVSWYSPGAGPGGEKDRDGDE